MGPDASKPSVSSLLRGLITGRRVSAGATDEGGAKSSGAEAALASLNDDAVPSPGKFSGIPAPGTTVAGKYVVERRIGAGGMGVVVAARHVQLERRVAIKFLHGRADHDGTAVERFLREARAAVALCSDHVARVLDVGTLESGEPFMVMEYLDGVDLRQLLDQNGPLPIRDAVDSVLQACEAIAEAHSLGLVHRDLKPANLFLSQRRDGTTIVKVLDFGISKSVAFNSLKPEKNLTVSGLVMGSPGYMSPEQVRNARTVDERTDVWALGLILYELVTGVHPFAGETAGDTFARIVSEKALSVRHHRSDVPLELAEVIGKCLEISLNQRIQSVGELAARILSYGSKDAGPLVEGILRWSAARPGFAQTTSGPTEQSADSPNSEIRLEPKASPGIGPAWLKSGTSTSFRRPTQGRAPIAVIVPTIGVTIIALSVFALSVRTRHQDIALASSPSPETSLNVSIAVDAGAPSASPGLANAAPRRGNGVAPRDERQSGENMAVPATIKAPLSSTKLLPSKRTPPTASTTTGQREIF